MAAFDGEFWLATTAHFSEAPVMSVVAVGQLFDAPWFEAGPVMSAISGGWYSQTDSVVVPVTHYHKRGWRVESAEFVEWDSTTRDAPYPGGGTVEPAVGTVLYRWVT